MSLSRCSKVDGKKEDTLRDVRNIAVIDYLVTSSNPIGSCHLRMIEGLPHNWHVTVFAIEFENPDQSRIRFVRVPAIKRPLFLLFLTFQLFHPFYYFFFRLRWKIRFDAVQTVEGNSLFGNIRFPHFCHKAFLKERWQDAKPRMILHRLASYMNHLLHAIAEDIIYRLPSTKAVVVPSTGLALELERFFGDGLNKKLTVIPDPTDCSRYRKPEQNEIDILRARYGFQRSDVVLVFTAVTNFERKGLTEIQDALRIMHRDGLRMVKLLVVGGDLHRINYYRDRAGKMGIQDAINFVGLVKDVRPFLWMSDIFVFPSSYETFSLATLEAAAAGLPIVVSRFHGLPEYVVNEENGLLVERSSESVAQAVSMLVHDSALRERLGRAIQETVKQFDTDSYGQRWIEFYRHFLQDGRK